MNRIQLYVIALHRKYLNMLHEFAVHNNLNLKFVDNVHLASEKALAVSNSLMEKGLILSVYFNNKHLSMIFSLQGKPFYIRNFPLKGAGEIPAIIRNEITENKLIENFKEYYRHSIYYWRQYNRFSGSNFKKSFGY